MKKLVTLIIIAVIVCFTAVLLNAQNNTIKANKMQNNGVKCSLFFEDILDGADKTLEHFENKIAYILKTGILGENCLINPLKEGRDISITYTGYTNENISKTELKYLIKSAIEFKEELEDYIESNFPQSSFLHDGDKYIVLQTEVSLNLPKAMQKILKKENKKFDIMDHNSKIFINIKAEESQENAGGVFIEMRH